MNQSYSDRRTRFLFDRLATPIQIVDLDGRLLAVNKAFEQWVGISAKDLLGRQAFLVMRSLDVGEKIVRWEDLRDKESTVVNGELKAHDGSLITSRVSISPVYDDRGRILQFVVIHQGMPDTMELVRRFEESQEQYRNIVESSLDGIVVILDGRLVFANPAAAQIFEYDSVEEMNQIDIRQTVAPASKPFVFSEGGLTSLGEDVLRNYEMKGLTKRGRVIDLEVNARLISWNGKTAVQASFRDITERKTLEKEQALWFWEQEALSAIDRQLVSMVDLQQMLDAIAHHAKSLTRADFVAVSMIESSGQKLRWRASKGNRNTLPPTSSDLQQIHSAIAERKEPLVIRDLRSNYRNGSLPVLEAEGVVSTAWFPLLIDGRVHGYLIVAYRRDHPLSTRELRLLTSMSEKSSLALANAELYESLRLREKELEILSGARVEAQEEERKRIAREIHDGLGQMLTAIKFNIEILEDNKSLPADDRRRIEDMKALLDSVMTEAREISYNLMPSVLVDFGLAPALQLLAEQTSRRNKINVLFHASGLNERLNPQLEISLYRIAQEALNNIVKHAQAKEAVMQIVCSPTSVTLTIEDDGKGFEAKNAMFAPDQKRGMGLSGMRERALSFNGKFTVESSPSKGTEIIVEIPLAGHKQK
ncbi:MAG TPA: PAS domain S-box protein [Bacteroidota bacterium]|nr:PAS domain S-box protein [Bacteroidota bacterium]